MKIIKKLVPSRYEYILSLTELQCSELYRGLSELISLWDDDKVELTIEQTTIYQDIMNSLELRDLGEVQK